jgi:hypothetical protein
MDPETDRRIKVILVVLRKIHSGGLRLRGEDE